MTDSEHYSYRLVCLTKLYVTLNMEKRLPVRQRLIETASDLFYRQGYNRTGINEILEKSGVAKASMYQHFRSKEEIAVEYLRRMDRIFTTEMTEYLKLQPAGKQQILGIFDFIYNFFHKDGYRGCWSQNIISEMPRDDERIIGVIRKQKDAFRKSLQQKISDHLEIRNANRLADRIYLLYESALLESQIFMSDWPILEARNMAESMIEEAE